tara:strand:- start:1306 stop:1905 length:600 start_codon:yes stop_codon:yes gene_type:complete
MVKRFLDLTFSILALIMLLPLLLILSIIIYLSMGSPILFTQKRPGKNNMPFLLFKFRTMKSLNSKSASSFSDAERLTWIGKFFRKASLDELPSLWNVIKGDISLVGPRPLLMEYLPLYSKEQMRRHEVKPGITGWAQINGRNTISWEEKFELDVWYVENQSLWLDIKILLLTIWKVIKREGINQKGNATMEKFKGNKSR